MHNFHTLDVWNHSRELGSEIYLLCAKITRPEARLITAQLRRSALSISANIAEGCGKNSRAETLRYLEIASGSAAETEHHLIVAGETSILAAEFCDRLLVRIRMVRRILRALIKKFPQ